MDLRRVSGTYAACVPALGWGAMESCFPRAVKFGERSQGVRPFGRCPVADMAEVLLPVDAPESSRLRLEAIGLKVICCPGPVPPALGGEIAGQVVFVPSEVFRSPQWPRLRVELARGARFFVVEVSEPGPRAVVAAMRDGAFDVVARGESDDGWRAALERAAESQSVWWDLYAGRVDAEGARLVGQSGLMRELRCDIERLGPTDVTVLILGESGTGKERVSAALHEAGRGGPLVTLNCAAMPRELIEAELFGVEKGSFTGAVRNRPGLVEQAQGGTLFLDEVGELDPAVQPKLLRFLETRKARRVGGDGEYAVRVRVVAATNRDLEREVREGRFRADLFYRLAEVVLRVPPLRAHPDDIPELARVFVEAANERFGKKIDAIEPALLLRLQRHPWPGNVRELKGVIDRLVLFHDGPVLRDGWWDPLGAHSSAPLPGTSVAGWGTPEPPPVISDPRVLNPGAAAGVAADASVAPLPRREERLALARRLLEEGKLPLGEVAARVGVHATTLFRWRRSGKAGANRDGGRTHP